MSTEIAAAYISLYTQMPGVKKDIEKALDGSGAAESAGQHTGDKFSAGLAGAVGGVAASVMTKAIDAVTSSIDGAISRVDTMNSFPKVMQNFGYSADDATESVNKISDGLKGLPTSLDSMAGMVQQLAPLTGSLDEATNLSLAFNNALLAGGKSTDVQANAMEQYTQMLSTGTVDLEAWRSVVTAMPGQVNQLAESMLGAGKGQMDLYDALKSGEVSMDDFNTAVMDLNQNGTGAFASFQDQAVAATDGIGTSQQNMMTAITRGLANLIDKVQPQLTAFMQGSSEVINVAFAGIATAMDWLAENGEVVIPVLSGLAAVILTAMAPSIWAAVTATWAWTAALLANPLTWIALAIGAVVGALVWFFTQTEVGKAAWAEFTRFLGEAWTNIVNVVSTAATWLWESVLSPVFSAIGTAFTWLYENVISPAIAGTVAFFTALGEAATWLWENAINPAITAIGTAWNWLYENVISPVVQGIIMYVQLWAAIFTWIYESIIVPVVTGIAAFINDVLVPVFQGIWTVVSFVFEAVSAIIQIAWGVMSYIFQQIVSFIQNTLGAVFTWLYEFVILPVWTAIQNAISFAWSVIQVIFTAVTWYITNVLAPIFTWLYTSIILPVWTAIQTAITAVYDWFVNTLVPGFQAVIAVFGAAFAWVNINVIQPVWRAIQDAIWNVYNWFNGTLVPIFKSAIDAIGAAFNSVKDTIAAAWESIKTAAMAPVKFVVESVYRDGIKKLFDGMAEKVGLDIRMPDAPTLAFARGGVLPGYTPGRDVHNFYSPTGGRLALSGGEGIIRPDALRALGGKGWLDAVNSSRGSADGVHFADGGVWDDLGKGVGDVVGWIGGAVENVAKIFTDPGGAVNALIREPVKALLENIGGGSFGEIVAEVPLKAIDGIVEWAKNTITPPASSGAVGNYTGGSTLQRLLPYISASGTMITDTYRDPAYNASVGGSPSSYHMDAANPAVDVAGSSAAMWSFYRMVMGDPGGWRQVLWQVAGHYDHVHVANQGGVFGDLPTKKYDSGGYLEPGYTTVYNGTGKPEPVFTSAQWADMENFANSGGDITLLVDGDPAMVELVRLMDIRIKGDGERRALNVMAGASRA